jgi:quercetin dioxygenase-like cupin family protein
VQVVIPKHKLTNLFLLNSFVYGPPTFSFHIEKHATTLFAPEPFQAPDPALVPGANVTFEPGARTAWHTHPLGQTLIVTAGAGWVQLEGGPIQDIHPGDVVWFAPREKHWHGATSTTAMTHIVVQEKLDCKVVDWMEHVTDEQYLNAH